MNSEYFIFNLIVISGPVIFGSMKRFYFNDKALKTLGTVVLVAIPYLIWDALVTGTHWHFNPKYISGIKLFNLPVEEILFFITVPYACLFTWEMIKKYIQKSSNNYDLIILIIQNLMIAGGVAFLIVGKGYTGLAFTTMGFAIFIDKHFGAKVISSNMFIPYFILITLFTLVFNGYLTWRPVVTYGEEYQIGFRIFTIPMEDFIYGYSLLILNTTLFEKILAGKSFKKASPEKEKKIKLHSA